MKASDNFSWNISSLTTSASQSASPQVGISSINHSIQVLAQRYCVDCKTAFDEMSKVTQTVTATRRELRQYDIKQQETLSQAIFSGPETDQLTGGKHSIDVFLFLWIYLESYLFSSSSVFNTRKTNYVTINRGVFRINAKSCWFFYCVRIRQAWKFCSNFFKACALY